MKMTLRVGRVLAFVLLIGALLISGCSGWLSGLFSDQSTPSASKTTTAPADEVKPSQTPAPLPTMSGPRSLTVWLPPQFNPQNDSVAGQLMQAQLDAFMDANPDIVIEVRVKAASGPGGLLESLTAASAAAPQALPVLVALSRSDLETAAVKGLVYPIDDLTRIQSDTSWYGYARQMGTVQGSTYGLPFAGDALLLAYRPAKIGDAPLTTWENLLVRGNPMLFPVADPNAFVTLSLYLGAGGIVQDEQGRPSLSTDTLEQVLRVYKSGARSGIFPASLANYQNHGQTWQAFQDGEADWCITWASDYLTDFPADVSATSLPALGDQSYTSATGWVWALAQPGADQQADGIMLAEFLIQDSFLGLWSQAAMVLPTRPKALDHWQDQSLQTIIRQLALAAQIRPSNEVLSSLEPVLKNATIAVIAENAEAAAAALKATEDLGIP
jgi:multiple sugar transport system substrate-binding protein